MNPGMSIFGNPCLHTQLSSLTVVSNASYMESDDFTADKALRGRANQTCISLQGQVSRQQSP